MGTSFGKFLTAWRAAALQVAIPFVLVAAGAPRLSIRAQGTSCDPLLVALAQGAFGYRQRGDRCEGSYARPVTATVLSLASLTESFEAYDPASGRPLILTWPRYGNSGVRLQARSLTRSSHYRMDALRPAGDTSYRWPSNGLGALAISRPGLGVTARVQQTVAGVARDVYLPLRIAQAPDTTQRSTRVLPRDGTYELVVYPTARLSQVFLTVASVGANGQPATYITRDQKLGFSYYPADQPIAFKVSGLDAAGLYMLEVAARLDGGGTTAIQQWLYHAGRPRTRIGG